MKKDRKYKLIVFLKPRLIDLFVMLLFLLGDYG